MESKGRLPLALRAAYMAMHRCSDLQFAKFGVTADQFVLLATLARGNAMTQRELAARMPSDPSTVRAMLGNHRRIAGAILNEGAFNVNSTSVEAWASLLASAKRNAMGVVRGWTVDELEQVIRDNERRIERALELARHDT